MKDADMGRVLSALSDPTRQTLLDLLSGRGEASATAAAEALPVSRQAVAKHLTVLEEAGVVTSRRVGREVLYAVRPERLELAAEWLRSLATSWDRRLRVIRDIAEGTRDLAGADREPQERELDKREP